MLRHTQVGYDEAKEDCFNVVQQQEGIQIGVVLHLRWSDKELPRSAPHSNNPDPCHGKHTCKSIRRETEGHQGIYSTATQESATATTRSPLEQS
eukprot:1433661-Amphidinium_carterae.1